MCHRTGKKKNNEYEMKDSVLAIIGAGPAGLTAAIYGVRAGLKVKVFDGGMIGGQTALTPEIENYPGLEYIEGPEFAMRLYNQAVNLGAEFVNENIIKIDMGKGTNQKKSIKNESLLNEKEKKAFLNNNQQKHDTIIADNTKYQNLSSNQCKDEGLDMMHDVVSTEAVGVAAAKSDSDAAECGRGCENENSDMLHDVISTETVGVAAAKSSSDTGKNDGKCAAENPETCSENEQNCLTLESDSSILYDVDALIYAAGVQRRKLGCPGEEEFAGKGVSYCAACDGNFFKGQTVVVAGGGNTALEDAVYLSNICQKVVLVHRRDSFRAEQILINQVKTRKNIELKMNTQIAEISGTNVVKSVLLESADGKTQWIDVDAVFVAIGMQPANDVIAATGKIDRDQSGYLLSDESCRTQDPRIFVSGDCRAKNHRQIVTAVADGAVAAMNAVSYLNGIQH